MNFSLERMFSQLNWRQSTAESGGLRLEKKVLPLNVSTKDLEGMGESREPSTEAPSQKGYRDDLGQQE